METIDFNLKISTETRDLGAQIIESTYPSFIKAGLHRIARDLNNYDNFILAGRLLIHSTVKSVPSLETYLALNHNILNHNVKSFIINNIEELETLVKSHEKNNYTNQDYFSADMRHKSYLLRAVPSKGPTETPVQKNLRLAVQFYFDESMNSVIKCFKEMCDGIYTHATPTEQNAGTIDGQMASCFLMSVYDSLDSMIYTGVGDMAMISRYNGGVGIGLNRIRHSDINGTGASAGVLPIARVYDKTISYVDQSRKRRGAATGFLNVWHIDVEDFTRAASNYIPHDLKLTGLHTCLWMHDLFFERAAKGEKWTLFCPNTVKDLQGKYGSDFEREYISFEKLAPIREEEFKAVEKNFDDIRMKLSQTQDPSDELKLEFVNATSALTKSRKNRIVYKVIEAQDLLKLIADTQLKSGKPYIMNGDRSNGKSNQQNIGPINNSNLCVEIVQYSDPNTFSSCNLASINLSHFGEKRFDRTNYTERRYRYEAGVKEGIMEELTKCYNFAHLGEISRSITRNLNKVIDHNFYPFDESKVKNFNMQTRPLGIGISGLDDAFKVVDIEYGSEESLILNKMIFACMYYNCLKESVQLAKEDGEYHFFRTGKCKLYDSLSKSVVEYDGSPLSNGFFQFDLWQKEYEQDLSLGRINPAMYDPADNIPIWPLMFGQNDTPTWDNLRKDVMKYGVRNSLLLALMPTASTAQLLRNAESAEAHQSNIYSRQVGNGAYDIVNRHLHYDLDEVGINTPEVNEFIYDVIKKDDKIIKSSGSLNGLADFVASKQSEKDLNRIRFLEKKYKTMFDIKPTLFLKMARQRGIYVDQSQSTNIYIQDPSLSQLMGIQMAAYHNKLKTHIYYLRNTIPTLLTGFNSKIVEGPQGSQGPQGLPQVSEDVIPLCRIDNPECTSCQ